MHKIKFQNYRLKAKQIEILYPRIDFDTERPVEYDIYANGIRLGTTHNQILRFDLILQNAHQIMKSQEKYPDLTALSPAQQIMISVNTDSSDKLSVSLMNGWQVIPHFNGDEIIKFTRAEVIGQFS